MAKKIKFTRDYKPCASCFKMIKVGEAFRGVYYLRIHERCKDRFYSYTQAMGVWGVDFPLELAWDNTPFWRKWYITLSIKIDDWIHRKERKQFRDWLTNSV